LQVDVSSAFIDNLEGHLPFIKEYSAVSVQKVVAIIPAAGQGVRMGSHKKQFLKLNGTPILLLTVRKFIACPEISEVFVATPKEDVDETRKMFEDDRLPKPVTVVEGGNRRQDSVENCLCAINPGTAFVAVHDAVRPFISPKQISAVIQAAHETGASILGILSVDTVKKVERNRILGTVPRENIVLAQTPQVFAYDLLKKAYDKAREDDYIGTDEASLVEHLGAEITVVQGTTNNIKITQPADLDLAQFFLQQELSAETKTHS
jgi:2-C-methyl-D-erythritol 4-phosphate cytidylyltransferase